MGAAGVHASMMRVAPLFLALLLAAGCLDGGDAPSTSSTPTPAPASRPSLPPGDISGSASLVDANTRFARDIFRLLSNETTGQDLVVSPYSIATALQMAYAGSDGSTRAAMRDALRLGAADATLDEQARALLGNMTSSDPNVTLRIGNSLWTDETFLPQANDGFSKQIASSYQGELFARDFGDEATVGEINDWASARTEGKIPKVLDTISPDEVMFLLNAVYFKGAWTSGFNMTCTHEADFTTAAGTTVQVDMMCGAEKGARHSFTQDAQRTIARLPYGDGRFAMYLVLPPEGVPLEGFLATWDANVTAEFSPYVELEMPRLRLATRALSLEPALTDLGMGIAFTDDADFTRIAQGLLLTRVVHDAILEVDEQGTVAAAVTTVGVGATSLPPEPLHLVFDRPFALMIRDDASGTVLFAGKVHSP